MSPYRGGDLAELSCPRCRKTKLPALDVATCPGCSGVWVSAFAASEVLAPEELRPDPVTRWWRVREPCPQCGDKMMLHGQEPGLFQGCDLHGYFIDADTVEHTRLARGVDHAALDRKRQDARRLETERDAREREATRRARLRAEIEQREAELARSRIVRLEYDDGGAPQWRSSPPLAAPPIAGNAEPALDELLARFLGAHAAEQLVRRIHDLEARVAELEKRQR